MLVADHDDMVEKALSWALRAMVEPDRRGVEKFLRRHESLLGKRVLREVRNKLETGRKAGPPRPARGTKKTNR